MHHKPVEPDVADQDIASSTQDEDFQPLGAPEGQGLLQVARRLHGDKILGSAADFEGGVGLQGVVVFELQIGSRVASKHRIRSCAPSVCACSLF